MVYQYSVQLHTYINVLNGLLEGDQDQLLTYASIQAISTKISIDFNAEMHLSTLDIRFVTTIALREAKGMMHSVTPDLAPKFLLYEAELL